MIFWLQIGYPLYYFVSSGFSNQKMYCLQLQELHYMQIQHDSNNTNLITYVTVIISRRTLYTQALDGQKPLRPFCEYLFITYAFTLNNGTIKCRILTNKVQFKTPLIILAGVMASNAVSKRQFATSYANRHSHSVFTFYQHFQL